MEKILIVDDNIHSAEMISETILPDLGYQGVIAARGESALNIIKQNRSEFSMLIMEWELPDMAGIKLLRDINSLGASMPTVILMNKAWNEISVAALELGVEQIIYKPIEREKLINSLDYIFENTRLKRQNAVLTTRLKEQYTWSTELTSAGRYIVSSIRPDDILQRVVEMSVTLTNADQGSLAVVDKLSGCIVLKAYQNKKGDTPKLVDMPIDNTIINGVVSETKPYRVVKGQPHETIRNGTGLLVDSIIHVPISDRENVLGILSVSRVDGDQLTAKDEAILISVADYASVALRNANLYADAKGQIDDHQQYERSLILDQERHLLAARAANVGIWDWDFKTNRTYFSKEWKSIIGYVDDEIGQTIHDWLELVHPSDLQRVKLELSACISSDMRVFISEYRLLHKDGSFRWILNQATIVRDEKDDVLRLVGTHIDITDRKQAQESLLYNAYHDVLTGLLNRPLFLNRINHAIRRYRRKKDTIFAILTMELNEFAEINNSTGRLVGDRLLLLVGDLLRKMLRSNDTLAHFGKGQYAVLIEELLEENDISRITSEILQIFAKPFVLDGNVIDISASCGIVFDLAKYEKTEDVLRDVEIAMRSARFVGKSSVRIFTPQLRDHMLLNIENGIDIRKAIDNEELEIFYQPIIGINQGEIDGFEALLRWTHPERGIITPDKFIHVAENNGLIIEIDRWVLQKACHQIRDWQDKSIANSSLSVSVNISAELINEKGFLNYVEETLKESQLQPSSLKLEITERSMVSDNKRTVDLLSRLLTLGVQVQIDDFGIGYSSLGYLSHLPLGGLKIDRSFVRGIMNNDRQREIVNAIVSLTSRLNVSVVAEGVETQEQMEYLKTIGCNFGQGFLIAEPLCSNDVPVWLGVYMSKLHNKASLRY